MASRWSAGRAGGPCRPGAGAMAVVMNASVLVVGRTISAAEPAMHFVDCPVSDPSADGRHTLTVRLSDSVVPFSKPVMA